MLGGDGVAHAQPGTSAAAMDYPYVAALARRSDGNDVYFCGGTLIAPRWILTAAHCFYDRNGGRIADTDLWAIAGSDSLRSAPKEALVRVERVVVHPAYASDSQANDLALVRLDQIVGPLVATLAGAGDALPGTATALGFGSFFEGELAGQALSQTGSPAAQTSDRLRRADVRIRDRQLCRALLKAPGDEAICVSAPPVAACVGDSGSPLVVPRAAGEARLIGVLSRGSGCAVPEPALVYTPVAPYRRWITATIGAR